MKIYKKLALLPTTIILIFISTGMHTIDSILPKNPSLKKGRLLFKDNFDNKITYTKEYQKVAEGWWVKTTHANWEQTKNGLKSIYKEGHMPVLTYKGELKNVIIELDFRFYTEEGKWSACRVSATNPVLNSRAYAVSAWANIDNKARSLGMILEHDEWKPGEITTVDHKQANFVPGKWYTLRLEVVGNTAKATCNGITVSGNNANFGIDKSAIYLGVGTSPHELRNFRVYEAIEK